MTRAPEVSLDGLVETLAAGSSDDEIGQIRRAYEFAAAAHDQQRRLSQELYVEHDLAVAAIMADLGVDVDTVTAAMLHDTLLPHTGKDLALLEDTFGPEVARLVSSLDKLTP
jgi:GTP pyrophosphokinase